MLSDACIICIHNNSHSHCLEFTIEVTWLPCWVCKKGCQLFDNIIITKNNCNWKSIYMYIIYSEVFNCQKHIRNSVKVLNSLKTGSILPLKWNYSYINDMGVKHPKCLKNYLEHCIFENSYLIEVTQFIALKWENSDWWWNTSRHRLQTWNDITMKQEGLQTINGCHKYLY